MQRYTPLHNPRPARPGPFIDYVLSAMHHQALRARARQAALVQRARPVVENRQTSAEQRWEGEGGSMRECPAGERAGAKLEG
jgi:hypothetical protein